MPKIYRVHYSYLAGHPKELKRVERSTHWFISEKRMRECSFWKTEKSPKRQFEYIIEESKIDLTCY